MLTTHWAMICTAAMLALVAPMSAQAETTATAGSAKASTATTTTTESTSTADSASTAPVRTKLPPCEELPTGDLSEKDLERLVPEGSNGKVRIRWKTESQEDNYGFNIMRKDREEGEYDRINSSIIPGEGTTNIPKEYCFEDRAVERGKVYFYYIESISNAGLREVVEGTMDTRVKVKTVEEERAWLKKRAAEAAAGQ